MDKTIRKFSSFNELKDEEYRYWQSVTPEERFATVFQMSLEAYRSLGYACDGTELRKIAVRYDREQVRRAQQ